jgi:hypothetical protein
MGQIIGLAWVVLMLSGGVWAQPSVPSSAPDADRGAQSVPALPPTLINSPPVQPVVRMENGQLSIDAPNSTLADVLRAVQAATGAVVEGAPPSDRIAVMLGPGNARDVVAALLSGTAYNYIILGSTEDPGAVTRILLSRSSQQSGFSTPVMPPPPPEQIPEEEVPDTSAVGGEGAAPPISEEPQEVQPTPAPPAPEGQPGAQPEDHPPTPEELFRQLLPTQPQSQTQQN